MNDNGSDRFDVLMDLAKKIADKNKPKSMVIIRTPDGKWLVTLHTLTDFDDNPLPHTGHTESLEAALETFVINPGK